jgi:hypothetical protein
MTRHTEGFLPRRGPLAFPVPPFIFSASYACIPIVDPVGSLHAVRTPPNFKDKIMILNRTGYNKKNTQAFYGGAARSIRIDVGAFPSKQAPETIEVADGVFEAKVVKVPRAKMTPEEKAAAKAAKANAPKPTLAERVAAAEARTAALKAKLAAAEQPSL